jgi:hypothetical protein
MKTINVWRYLCKNPQFSMDLYNFKKIFGDFSSKIILSYRNLGEYSLAKHFWKNWDKLAKWQNLAPKFFLIKLSSKPPINLNTYHQWIIKRYKTTSNLISKFCMFKQFVL